MKKRNIEVQLATKKRALDQANKLAEVRRKLAEMEAEVENLQRAYQEMPEDSLQQKKPHHPLDNLPSLTIKI